MTRGSVAKEAIEQACDRFLDELVEWEDRDDDDEDCCGIRVVIARDVTPAMFKRIPKAWLKGLVVARTDEGVLELMDVEGAEHANVKSTANASLRLFADLHPEQHLVAATEFPGDYNGFSLTPDVMISGIYPANGRTDRPFIIVEVEVTHLGMEKIIHKARKYLSAAHVERAVFFKLFRQREQGLRRRPRLLFKAALAVVFARDGNNNYGPGQLANIRVVDEVSFGTAPLHESVLRNLSTVHMGANPVGQIRPIAASPFEFAHIQMAISDVTGCFAAMDQITRRLPHELVVHPDRGGFQASVRFDLKSDAQKRCARLGFPSPQQQQPPSLRKALIIIVSVDSEPAIESVHFLRVIPHRHHLV